MNLPGRNSIKRFIEKYIEIIINFSNFINYSIYDFIKNITIKVNVIL